MLLDVDNELSGIELWFGTEGSKGVICLGHMNAWATINTSNLVFHQWLITTHPHLVAQYIQFDDNN